MEREVRPRVDRPASQLVDKDTDLAIRRIWAQGRPHLNDQSEVVRMVGLVQDNGVGMDKEGIERAFEPFYSTKAKGTGLGLPVCSQIVAMHDGKINIESTPGEGTTVTVSLPQTRKKE